MRSAASPLLELFLCHAERSCVIPSAAEGPRIFLDANPRNPNHESTVVCDARGSFRCLCHSERSEESRLLPLRVLRLHHQSPPKPHSSTCSLIPGTTTGPRARLYPGLSMYCRSTAPQKPACTEVGKL